MRNVSHGKAGVSTATQRGPNLGVSSALLALRFVLLLLPYVMGAFMVDRCGVRDMRQSVMELEVRPWLHEDEEV